MHILGCLGIFFIAIVVAILVAVKNILTLLFNPGGASSARRRTQNTSGNYRQSHSQSQQSTRHTQDESPRKSKVFEDNEGEYVDFEEVK